MKIITVGFWNIFTIVELLEISLLYNLWFQWSLYYADTKCQKLRWGGVRLGLPSCNVSIDWSQLKKEIPQTFNQEVTVPLSIFVIVYLLMEVDLELTVTIKYVIV